MLYLVLIIFALAGGAITVLVFENFSTLSMDVHLTLFGRHAPALPLGVLLLLSFILGALLLYVVTLISAMRERRELRKLRKRLAELEAAQPGQIGLPGQAPMTQQQSSAAQLFVPMPGAQSLTQAHGPQYLFPPPGYYRERGNQGPGR